MAFPYSSAVNEPGRASPGAVIRDNFTWLKGRHTLQIGGTFKYINPNSYTFLNYNEPLVGLSVTNPPPRRPQ